MTQIGTNVVSPNQYAQKTSTFILDEKPKQTLPKEVKELLSKLPKVVIEENPAKKSPSGSTVCYAV